jgi:hypothetical protein
MLVSRSCWSTLPSIEDDRTEKTTKIDAHTPIIVEGLPLRECSDIGTFKAFKYEICARSMRDDANPVHKSRASTPRVFSAADATGDSTASICLTVKATETPGTWRYATREPRQQP